MDQRIEQFAENAEQAGEKNSQSSIISKPRAMFAAAVLMAMQTQAACSGAEFTVGIPADEADADAGAGGDGGEGGTDAEGGSDGGTDAQLDAGTDSGDAADAGPKGTFSNTPGENECIHWSTRNGGVTQAFASDNHVCEPKPLSPMPIQKGDLVYIWSKHNLSANKVHFTSPFNVVNYFTKCSGFSLPPDKKEMETDLGTGGFVAATNTATLPNVELTNGGCTNGVAYGIQIQP